MNDIRRSKRKTVSVEELKWEVNRMLALPVECLAEEEKKGICDLLETVLFATENYHGFNFVDWLNGGFERWQLDGEPDFPKKSEYLGREYSRKYY